MFRKNLFILVGCFTVFSLQVKSQHTISVFDKVLFYDGYNNLDTLAAQIEPLPAGFYRLSTSVITTKLSEGQLDLLSGGIRMDVVIKAACDNYDRLGHVNIAFVHKDSALYTPSEVQRIEIARFVTPFMNKNLKPDTVPYTFKVDYLQHLFQDMELRDKYNFWMELDVFGVPYAANTQVAGCAGRNDVFYGSLTFVTNQPTNTLEDNNVFIPLFMKNRFNNYHVDGTDTIGKTIKTKKFTVDENLTDAQLVLITSNHGAATGGEEYNRRWHYVSVNDEEVLRYRPGRTSCEPFRVYNTQGNGIYSQSPRTDAEWQSFSNWCPGDVIDTRIIKLGALQAGEYTFKISVPDARFIGNNGAGTDGNFPLSLYFQGKTSGAIAEVIYTPVTNIANVPTSATAGTELTLTGTVIPSNATNQNIVWSIFDADTTGATISENKLNATNAGVVVITATVEKGESAETDYMQNISITVNPAGDFFAVTDISGVPATITAKNPIVLATNITPSNATNQNIVWSITNAGTTGATINGNTLNTTAAGTVVITATIINGLAIGQDYTQDFSITVNIIPVSNILYVPTKATIGIPLTLGASVMPSNATNQSIIWNVKNMATTGASIIGNTLYTTADGTATITATITNGLATDTDYTQDFNIKVSAAVNVTNIVMPKMVIYPNPTTGQLRIDASENGEWTTDNMEYSIYSVTGQKIMQGKLLQDSTTINVEYLAKGMYYLKVTGNKTVTVKFIKE